ncbi:MAG: diacylglycerol kinase family protein [Burkholderiales bacterium]|nr:diacylglycerol kinase family protein [Burkholderiales bacterium]
MTQPSYLSRRLHSFGYALRGLAILAATQHNARIHAIATVLVIAAGVLFRISLTEWCLIVLAITCVWVAEALNTAIEFLVDLVSPDPQPLAAKAKDVAAGAVLIAAIGALAIGIIVLGPKIWDSVLG